MLALIDADIVAYRTAAVNENEDERLAVWQADELVKRILEDTNATEWRLFLSGENNFRKQLYPDYKKHRELKPKPKHLEAVREHLVLEWGAEICDGYEADDALGMHGSNGSVIASIDKDLLQVPGEHYHFVKREWVHVSSNDGWRNFYIQLLVGDAADNIPGCPGIGKVKAPKILQSTRNELEMYHACIATYIKQGSNLHDMHINAQLLYIWRKENDTWTPPIPKT